jgi:hypothetical protein
MWTETQIRTMCAGKMTAELIEAALLKVSGADHTADQNRAQVQKMTRTMSARSQLG